MSWVMVQALRPMARLIAAEVADTGHGAVVVDDFTNHGGFRQSGEAGEVEGRFGVAGPAQHAIRNRAERKNVARPDKGVGVGTRIGEQADGVGAVGGGDAGGDAMGGIDADGEGGFVAFMVPAGHLREVEFLGACRRGGARKSARGRGPP